MTETRPAIIRTAIDIDHGKLRPPGTPPPRGRGVFFLRFFDIGGLVPLRAGTDTELLSIIVIHGFVLLPRQKRYAPPKRDAAARERTITARAISGTAPRRVAGVRSERRAISSVNACAVKISLCWRTSPVGVMIALTPLVAAINTVRPCSTARTRDMANC